LCPGVGEAKIAIVGKEKAVVVGRDSALVVVGASEA